MSLWMSLRIAVALWMDSARRFARHVLATLRFLVISTTLLLWCMWTFLGFGATRLRRYLESSQRPPSSPS